MKKLLCAGAILFCFSGCAFLKPTSYSEEMLTLSASLKRLSAAVESAVQYKDAPPEMENEDLLQFATAHNPKLLDSFKKYTLKAKNSNKHSIVLLCDAEGKHALVEDSGCTGELDAQHWQQKPLPPCAFTLQLERICNEGEAEGMSGLSGGES